MSIYLHFCGDRAGSYSVVWCVALCSTGQYLLPSSVCVRLVPCPCFLCVEKHSGPIYATLVLGDLIRKCMHFSRPIRVSQGSAKSDPSKTAVFIVYQRSPPYGCLHPGLCTYVQRAVHGVVRGHYGRACSAGAPLLPSGGGRPGVARRHSRRDLCAPPAALQKLTALFTVNVSAVRLARRQTPIAQRLARFLRAASLPLLCRLQRALMPGLRRRTNWDRPIYGP